MKRSYSRIAFALALAGFVIFIAAASAPGTAVSHALTAAQQHAVIGGTACEFAGGAAAGLFVASLFGCVVCGAGSGVLAIGILVFC